ncbi:hypothetical protein DFH09DRAFT_1164833 [Mycena vulgaris]|nr:hypothetical protein DFH09DRAFT_1164833 [Mycena vulgaris]
MDSHGRLASAGPARDVHPKPRMAHDRVRFLNPRSFVYLILSKHGIAKSIWVKWAEILLARGIKLTDEAGTGWRPRLKASRAKGR